MERPSQIWVGLSLIERADMLFELTNEQRTYLGLTPAMPFWELVPFSDTIYLYFDGDTIRKRIIVTQEEYREDELNEATAENRTIILPKTRRGKPKKLNNTGLRSCAATGAYFYFGKHVQITNHTTETTFYTSYGDGKKYGSLDALKQWLDWWVADSSEDDLRDIAAFHLAQRQHCKVKEGDFFTFKIGRREYGFGRILLDIRVLQKAKKAGMLKEKHYGLLNLMGQPLIVKVYKKISDSPEVDLDKLSECGAFPSQPIMDNAFCYGEYQVIGHHELRPEELEFPISYGRSICAQERDTVYLQYGLIYKDTTIREYSKYLVKDRQGSSYPGPDDINPYSCLSIGFGLVELRDIQNMKKRIGGETALMDTDAEYIHLSDLRHPQNLHIKREIFSFFGLDADKSYSENMMLA